MNRSPPPGSSVCGILQATILEWVAMPSSRGSSWPRDQTHISYISCIEVAGDVRDMSSIPESHWAKIKESPGFYSFWFPASRGCCVPGLWALPRSSTRAPSSQILLIFLSLWFPLLSASLSPHVRILVIYMDPSSKPRSSLHLKVCWLDNIYSICNLCLPCHKFSATECGHLSEDGHYTYCACCISGENLSLLGYVPESSQFQGNQAISPFMGHLLCLCSC